VARELADEVAARLQTGIARTGAGPGRSTSISTLEQVRVGARHRDGR